jgi:hypothetical protein
LAFVNARMLRVVDLPFNSKDKSIKLYSYVITSYLTGLLLRG